MKKEIWRACDQIHVKGRRFCFSLLSTTFSHLDSFPPCNQRTPSSPSFPPGIAQQQAMLDSPPPQPWHVSATSPARSRLHSIPRTAHQTTSQRAGAETRWYPLGSTAAPVGTGPPREHGPAATGRLINRPCSSSLPGPLRSNENVRPDMATVEGSLIKPRAGLRHRPPNKSCCCCWFSKRSSVCRRHGRREASVGVERHGREAFVLGPKQNLLFFLATTRAPRAKGERPPPPCASLDVRHAFHHFFQHGALASHDISICLLSRTAFFH